MTARTIHLDASADFHPVVLLPGDPARALAIAQVALEQPRMFNHRRGLWGYSGTSANGIGLLIQSTGMGGPSAAIICEELAQLGARIFLRVGTCGALSPELKLGDLLIASEVVGLDGASRALGQVETRPPTAAVFEALCAAAGDAAAPARIASADLFYDGGTAVPGQLADSGAVAVEMEAAAVFAVARKHGIAHGCMLGVTDIHTPGARRRLDQQEVEDLGVELGRVAVAALERLELTVE